jgi:hypothetical protein
VPPFGSQTHLWRYTDLRKLMLLAVKRKVFIPTLSTLRRSRDPKETLLPSYSDETLAFRLFEGKKGQEAWEWLVNQIEARRKDPHAAALQPRLLDMFWGDSFLRPGIVLEEWLDQLSIRRAVWCWASPSDPQWPTDSYESLALWNSYASSEIAIRTTFDNVRNAVEASKDLKNQEEGIAFRVKYRKQGYAINQLFNQPSTDQPFRPYAFKNRSYDYEQEIRIILCVNGHADAAGISVEIDPRLLLEGGKVVISPHIPEAEGDELVELIRGMLKEVPRLEVCLSSEMQKEPGERLAPVKQFMQKLGPLFDPLAKEAGIPELLREL